MNSILKRILLGFLIAAIVFIGLKLAIKTIYPIDYKNYIYEYSQKYGIDPYLVCAIINVESRFQKEACSRKDARGLMQISPETGKWAAKELKLKEFTLESLYEPETNIMFGCWYLNVLTQEFNGDLKLILAAYNGGSGNVNKWLTDNRYSEDGKNLKYIPFQETSDYLEKVLNNYEKYKKLYIGTFERKKAFKESFLNKMINTFKETFKQYLTTV